MKWQRERAREWRREAKESRQKLRQLKKRRTKAPSRKRREPNPGLEARIAGLRARLAEHKASRKSLRIERDGWRARCRELEAPAAQPLAKRVRVSQFGAALVGASIPLLFSHAWLLFACTGALGLALMATR